MLACCACTKHQLVDVVMARAHRPVDASEVPVEDFTLLAGDLHCHVSPPDDPGHVGRGLTATAALAESEGLDFVVLTPHVWSEALTSPHERAQTRRAFEDLTARVEALDTPVSFFVGLEYSTRLGHATLAFADASAALGRIDVRSPDAFVRAWVERGGLIVINHPMLTPTASIVPNARWDLSWRPWTGDRGRWPGDIVALHRLAAAWEVDNSAIDHLRDYHLLGDPGTSRRSMLRQLDRRIVSEQRRMSAVGGSDSHSHYLRAVTWVLAADRSERAIRDAIVAGRTCVRSPWGCAVRARIGEGPLQPPGASLVGAAEIEVVVSGRDATVWLDGVPVGHPSPDVPVRLAAPSACAVLRATVDGGESGPFYVNCDFAAAR